VAGGDGADGAISIAANSLTNSGNVLPAPGQSRYSDFIFISVLGGSGTVASDPPGIGCPPDCLEEYDPGALVMLTATPAAGFVFESWTVECAGQGTQCLLSSGSLRTATAIFSRPTTATPPPPAPAKKRKCKRKKGAAAAKKKVCRKKKR
jgi:hypothetical protein